MRFISSAILLTLLWISTPNAAIAHGFNQQTWHAHNCFHNHLNTAYHYPHQLAAAALWRRNNLHVNLHLHPHIIAPFNWHPSVVALLYHRDFVPVYYSVQSHRPWRKKRVRVRRH